MVLPGLRRLFHSNEVPTSLEIASIRQDFEVIASKVAQLRSELQHWEVELEQHRGVLSPMRGMPLEILGHIFLCNPLSNEEVVQMGLVCRAWRDATLVTHQLWTSASPGPETDLDKAVQWLSRSGGLPKSLWLRAECNGQCSLDILCVSSQAVVSLLTSGPALDTLSLSFKTPLCLRSLIRALKQTAGATPVRPWDTLRRLEVNLHTGSEVADWSDSVSAEVFPDLPRVASLSVDLPDHELAFDHEDEARRGVFNVHPQLLATLTALELACDWPGDQVLKTIQSCHNLESLELNVRYQELPPRVISEGRVVSLPKLRTLRLRHHVALDILNLIRTPVLSTLDLGLSGDAYRIDDNDLSCEIAMQDFAKRHGGTIRSFRLYDAVIKAGDLASIMRELPGLTHLQLDRLEVDYDVFWDTMESRFRDSKGVSQRYLPKLEWLEVFQVELGDAPDIFLWISRWLRSKGPHRIDVDVSFKHTDEKNPIPEDVDIMECWYDGAENDDLSDDELAREMAVSLEMNPEEFGASLRAVPWVDHGDE